MWDHSSQLVRFVFGEGSGVGVGSSSSGSPIWARGKCVKKTRVSCGGCIDGA